MRNRHHRQISSNSLSTTYQGPWGDGVTVDPAQGSCMGKINWWSLYARFLTFYLPGCILKCMGFSTKSVQQAFREKIALCFTIFVMCLFLGFITFGIGPLLCPASAYGIRILWSDLQRRVDAGESLTWAFGNVYSSTSVANAFNVPVDQVNSRDLGNDLAISFNLFCSSELTTEAVESDCSNRGTCWDPTILNNIPVLHEIAFEWDDLKSDGSLFVINGAIIQIPALNNTLFKDSNIDDAIYKENSNDLTRLFSKMGPQGYRLMSCLNDLFKVGHISRVTLGCFAFNLFQLIALICIGTLIIVRFVLAVGFSWVISRNLDRMSSARIDQDENSGEKIPSKNTPHLSPIVMRTLNDYLGLETISPTVEIRGTPGDDPYVLLLVTCYSEDEDSLRLTLDSLVHTDYHDQRKLLFIVADGLVFGSGNSISTPEIVREMLSIPEEMQNVKPKGYSSIGEKEEKINMAKVYAGHYSSRGRIVPCILIEKCGTIQEEKSAGKPGNRGKRDSQLILMNFMQRVLFNERMCPLDFDLFNRINWLMGVAPDVFEIVLMVDADTKVAVGSLQRMVDAMRSDERVMGLCGETRIANKWGSWVTMIQVFEYYVSHHLGKAFESFFGGVTCLPGCFCMYRLHLRRAGLIIPILASPIVIGEYSRSGVETLHEKNLLLLGEDRFLTTILLKCFPGRKMIFVPKAYCKTIVPDSLWVLISQRRRWINSTIHNLLELVLVRDLCGVFCFSMQFVIFMELIGTVVLPAAIIFTGVLIVSACINPVAAIVPLILLGMVLGLPAVLILLISRKLIYIWWMLIYILALPIWNFVLPVYAYWHSDDFSWGDTRKTSDSMVQLREPDVSENQLDPEINYKTWIAWSNYWNSKINPVQSEKMHLWESNFSEKFESI